ncbi:hypothetical protein QOT17_008874 [Balamuthia mandrillaris]
MENVNVKAVVYALYDGFTYVTGLYALLLWQSQLRIGLYRSEPCRKLLGYLEKVTEPALSHCRNILQQVGFREVAGLDLSPVVLMALLYLGKLYALPFIFSYF